MAAADPTGSVKSAMRALDVLDLVVGQARPVAATEMARALGIPMSSLSYLLATLVERGNLERVRRLYSVGPAMERLQPRLIAPTLAELVAPLVRAIRYELNETSSFFVRDGFEIQAVATDLGQHALQYSVSVGHRAPLHSFAAGKALLATFDEEELGAYFGNVDREPFTPNTIVSEKALRTDLELVRRTGVSRAHEEHTIGIVAIGRAATLHGAAVGAFSVAIPAARYDARVDKEAVRLLRWATESLDAGADRSQADAPVQQSL